MTDENYINGLRLGSEFSQKAGSYLGMTKKEIKFRSCNQIYDNLKIKRKEIDLLILEFECILKLVGK